jgi:hypothetical protein
MLQTLLAARRLALHSQLCYRGSSRAACGAFAGKRNSRALSTEAAPVEDEGGDDVGDFGFHSAGQSTQQAWLTNLDGTKIGLINVSNFIFGARMSANWLNWFHDRVYSNWAFGVHRSHRGLVSHAQLTGKTFCTKWSCGSWRSDGQGWQK